MAQHTVTMVEKKEINDENVRFRFRCCGDASTDSDCTVSLLLTPEELATAIQNHKTKMAQNHDQKEQFRANTHPVVPLVADSTVTV
jgi:hypothetical protein